MRSLSLRVRMTFILVLTVSGAILLCWIINKTFLSSYYQYSKIKLLDTAFEKIHIILNQEPENEDTEVDNEGDSIVSEERNFLYKDYYTMFPISKLTQQEIDKAADEYNVKVLIFSTLEGGFAYPDTIYFTMSHEEAYAFYNYNFMFYLLDYTHLYKTEQLKVTNSYDVYKYYDYGKEAYFIDFVGRVEDETYIILRANFESIQESADIANTFFSYVGIAAIIISAVLMYVISRGFTKPMLDMSKIAKRMTELDFEVYYPVKTEDEIGELGSSLNTLSKKLEATITELKSANNELMNDIEKKTEIDEMRKDFLSNVTHELKTPIALIQGYAEGLKDNINDDAESREFYCEVIVDEAYKMNNMVKKLLSLSQIETGKSFDMARFDITSLVYSLLNSFDIMIKQKNIILHIEKYEPIFVWADEYLIEEAISNYISNAINHVSGANIIEIKLIMHQDIVRLAVFNTGEQIPADEIDKVWIKFYKVDKARTREYGGSGIGLSIVKAIMDSHNKPYGAVNHKNGVEFWLELDASK